MLYRIVTNPIHVLTIVVLHYSIIASKFGATLQVCLDKESAFIAFLSCRQKSRCRQIFIICLKSSKFVEKPF